MTQTTDVPAHRGGHATDSGGVGDDVVSADAAVEQWLAAFDEALRSGEADRAAELFDTEGYWRDFVAFTWNLKTLEGREQIRRMLESQLPAVSPSAWSLDEPASVSGEVIESWVTFETAAGRGWAHLRLRDGRARTLLTTMQELKGHEEKKRRTRDQGD